MIVADVCGKTNSGTRERVRDIWPEWLRYAQNAATDFDSIGAVAITNGGGVGWASL